MSSIATTSDDLLAELLERRSAPVATVVVPGPDVDEGALDRIDMEVKDIRRRLEQGDLPEAVVDEVVEAVRQHRGQGWLGIVADVERVVTAPLVDGRAPMVHVGTTPRFVPFLRDRFDHRPHVVVRCDRTGAAIARVERGRIERDTQVDGEEQHVQKVRAGGWSEKRFQNHTEHTWEQNAKEIAEAVRAEAEAMDAELIVVTGDGRAVQLVADHLPEHWHDRLVLDDHEPTDAASEEAVFERARTVVRDRAAREVVGTLERFAEHRGRHDRAAEGVDDVFAALRQGAVEVLLVAEDVDDTVHVAVEDPRQVATDSQLLADSGFTDVVTTRATDAAVEAALAGGAEVLVVPSHGPDAPKAALGAILRF